MHALHDVKLDGWGRLPVLAALVVWLSRHGVHIENVELHIRNCMGWPYATGQREVLQPAPMLLPILHLLWRGLWKYRPQSMLVADAEALPDQCCVAAVIVRVHVPVDGRVVVDVCPQHAVTSHVVAHLLQHDDVASVLDHQVMQVLEQGGPLVGAQGEHAARQVQVVGDDFQHPRPGA